MPKNLTRCCYIQTGEQTGEHSDDLYHLAFGNAPDEYTESCGQHLGQMVTDSGGAHVTPIPTEA